jgi:hypothetical protein
MPAITSTQETEIRTITIQTSSGKMLARLHLSKQAEHGCSCLLSQLDGRQYVGDLWSEAGPNKS